MNMQCSVIWKLMIYNFEVSHHTVESTKTIFYAKVEGAVDHCTVTRRLRKFYLGLKNLNSHARSCAPGSVDSEAVEVKPASSNQISSDELNISQLSVFAHLQHLELQN